MMPPKVNTKGTMFEKLFGEPLHIEDMPATETTPEHARFRSEVIAAGDMFTRLAHVLRSSQELPEEINKLASLMWDLVGHRITPVAIGPDVVAIHFYAEIPKQGQPVACILCPPKWLHMVEADPIMQFGALVFAGSQARDYYNERLAWDGKAVHSRSRAYESEFLHCVMEKYPFTPNDYQKKVMEDFPKGLASLEAKFWYESKPFVERRG